MKLDVDLPFNGWDRTKKAIQGGFTKGRLRRQPPARIIMNA